jgi:hypothetical protein
VGGEGRCGPFAYNKRTTLKQCNKERVTPKSASAKVAFIAATFHAFKGVVMREEEKATGTARCDVEKQQQDSVVTVSSNPKPHSVGPLLNGSDPFTEQK